MLVHLYVQVLNPILNSPDMYQNHLSTSQSSGDAYAGLDHKVELTFHAHAEDEFVRKMPVHQVESQGWNLTTEGDHGCWFHSTP